MQTPKYLIIAPAWVGDMLMSQPLYQLLKTKHPTCSIDIVAPKSTAILAKRMPQIDNVFTLDVGHGQLNIKQRYRLGRDLKKNRYDNAIILPNSLKSALVPFFAGIKKRTGFLGEQRYLLLNDIRHLKQVDLPSLIARYAYLGVDKDSDLPALNNPQLSVDEANLQKLLTRFNIDSQKPCLALCPGAEFGPAKQWPADYYATVAQTYLQKNWQVCIFGTDKEKSAADTIQTHTDNKCINLCGQTSLLDVIDLLSHCKLALTNDSGLMHIAAAVNTPLVAVYGSTSPTYTPPAADNAKILHLNFPCMPCFKRECPLTGAEHLRCLRQLKPELVLNALEGFH